MRILLFILLLFPVISNSQVSAARKLLLTQATGTVSGIDTFLTSGTWTCPAGVTFIDVYAIAGGNPGDVGYFGDPGGSDGGGGGAYARKTFTVVPSTGYSVTVGVGGIGGTSLSWTPGLPSSFWYNDSLYADSPTNAGDISEPGLAVNCIGDIVYSGGYGTADGLPTYSGAGGGAGGHTGNGGNASGSTGGTGNSPGGDGADGLTTTGTGLTGGFPGGGGSGGFNASGESQGGHGAAGIVVIMYGDSIP